MKKVIVIFVFIVLAAFHSFAESNQSLVNTVRFLDFEKAKALLNVEDEYTKYWSQFDLDSRMHKLKATREEQFRFMSQELRNWNEEEKEKVRQQLEAIDASLSQNAFHVKLPKEISLVKSSLNDEGGAEGYTRFNCIVLKENILELSSEDLKNLLLHELFHVLTRNNSQFKSEMYAVIGFHTTNEIELPSELSKMKISNPDAPKKDSYISLTTKEGNPIDCMMLLYTKKKYTTGSFFDYLNIGLLKLIGDERKEVALENGKPIIYSIEDLIGFYEQVGQNTAYIIDPEEVLADNFVYSITQKSNLKSPEIVDKIQAILKK